MTAIEVRRMRAAVRAILDLLVKRIAALHTAPAPVRDAALDLVTALRGTERRIDVLLAELEQRGGAV